MELIEFIVVLPEKRFGVLVGSVSANGWFVLGLVAVSVVGGLQGVCHKVGACGVAVSGEGLSLDKQRAKED